MAAPTAKTTGDMPLDNSAPAAAKGNRKSLFPDNCGKSEERISLAVQSTKLIAQKNPTRLAEEIRDSKRCTVPNTDTLRDRS